LKKAIRFDKVKKYHGPTAETNEIRGLGTLQPVNNGFFPWGKILRLDTATSAHLFWFDFHNSHLQFNNRIFNMEL